MILRCDCGKRHTIPEAEGVTIGDGDRLRFDGVFLTLDGGRYRTLTLRQARGNIRDATPEERREVMRKIASAGGKASASKLSAEQLVERSRKANEHLTPEQRTERARKAGKARHTRRG